MRCPQLRWLSLLSWPSATQPITLFVVNGQAHVNDGRRDTWDLKGLAAKRSQRRCLLLALKEADDASRLWARIQSCFQSRSAWACSNAACITSTACCFGVSCLVVASCRLCVLPLCVLAIVRQATDCRHLSLVVLSLSMIGIHYVGYHCVRSSGVLPLFVLAVGA